MRISDWSSDVCSSDLEPSERWTTVIFLSGSCTPPLSAAMAGSFHFLTLPRKMLARVSPSSFIAPDSMPLTCTTGTTPPITDGNCARPRSEEHTSELQSLMRISYAVFCLNKKKPTSALTKQPKEDTKHRLPT